MDCVYDLFEVNTKGGTVGENFDGYFSGLKSTFNFLGFGSDGTFTITTDSSSMSTVDISKFMAKQGAIGLAVGLTRQDDAYTNYIANDITLTSRLPIFRAATWVQEVGNSLGIITDKHPPTRDGFRRYGREQEDGASLQDCVFGGKVTERGGVARPR